VNSKLDKEKLISSIFLTSMFKV